MLAPIRRRMSAGAWEDRQDVIEDDLRIAQASRCRSRDLDVAALKSYLGWIKKKMYQAGGEPA
jgi:hypothetical protein